MISIKEGLEFIELGEEDGTVIFDSATGDSVVLDSVSNDIINCFKEHHEIDDVVAALADIYDASIEVIKKDVVPFVEECLEKGILVCT